MNPPDNDVSLKEHIEALLTERSTGLEQRFQAQEKAVAAALAASTAATTAAMAAAEKAVEAAAVNVKEWRVAQNEWRATVTDLIANLFSRREGEALEARLNDLADRFNQSLAANQGSREAMADAALGRARSSGLRLESLALAVSVVVAISAIAALLVR